jgi:ribosome recycling factor
MPRPLLRVGFNPQLFRVSQMTTEATLKDAKERKEKALTLFKNELRGHRTGRATPALVENIRVEYYGSPTPLNQLAQISTPDPTSIVIRPFDAAALNEIEKAIRGSDLGMSPNNDGKIIRLAVPAMSGDQRKKMAAHIKKLAEDAKIACRNVRRDANKHIETAEKDGDLTEDERDKAKEKVQVLLKSYEDQIQEAADKKTKDVLEQ